MKVDFVDNRDQQYEKSAVQITLPGNSGEGKLFLGDRWSASLLQLRSRSCNHVVNCSQYLHNVANEKSVKYLKIDPDRDFNDDLKPNPFNKSVKFISKALSKGENVLVHCETGKSKAAVVVINFVMVACGMTLANSYKLVKECFPEMRPRPSLMCILIIEEKRHRNDVATMGIYGRNVEFISAEKEEISWMTYLLGAAFTLLAAVSVYSHSTKM